jgi:hypothetical protein
MLSRLVSVVLIGLTVSSAHAAILHVDSGGVLTGASGVNVSGSVFDVAFEDGSCDSLFNNCDPTEFAFSSLGEAEAAAAALLGQVFVDSSLGNFDTDPSLTFGCVNATTNCLTRIPFSASANLVSQVVVVNVVLDANDRFSNESSSSDNSSSNFSNVNFARFSRSVPEPSSLLLFLAGILGMTPRVMRRVAVQ